MTVLEVDPNLRTNARVAGADVVICDSFEHGLESISGGEDTYFIILTRGHRYDEVCLGAIVEKPNAYIGMMAAAAEWRSSKKSFLSRDMNVRSWMRCTHRLV